MNPIDAHVPTDLGFSFSFSGPLSASFEEVIDGATAGGMGVVIESRPWAFEASVFICVSQSFNSDTKSKIALKAPTETPAVVRASRAEGAAEIAAETMGLDVNDSMRSLRSLRSLRSSDFIKAFSVEIEEVLGIDGSDRSVLQD